MQALSEEDDAPINITQQEYEYHQGHNMDVDPFLQGSRDLELSFCPRYGLNNLYRSRGDGLHGGWYWDGKEGSFLFQLSREPFFGRVSGVGSILASGMYLGVL